MTDPVEGQNMDERTPEPATLRRPYTTGLRVPEKGSYSLPWKERLQLWPLFHEAAYGILRITGLRTRLYCPRCKAVGTWKPHGGWLDEQVDRWGFPGAENLRTVRRWLCKFCGYYVGPEGVVQAWPDPERGWWALPAPFDPESPEQAGETPSDVLYREMGKTWPWRG